MIEKHATNDARKCVLSCPNGRMVILEQVEEERACNETLAEMARAGKEEGYALFAETRENGLLSNGAPGLFLSILVRPGIKAKKAGILSAVAAVAAARAIEETSDTKISIRWVNDLFSPAHKLGAMITSGRITPSGYLDYAVIGISIALSPDDFRPKLGDVIRQVFSDESKTLSTRLTEHILLEFFTIYDRMLTDRAFLTEYRMRCAGLVGKRVKVLVGGKYVRARIARIDDRALLVVSLRNGEELTISSRSEVVF